MNSERLNFSHYTPDDFDDYFQLVSNADVMKMVTGRPDIESEARKRFGEMLNYNIKNPIIGRFKVSLSSNGSFVGHAKLEMTKKKKRKLDIYLCQNFGGRGMVLK